MGRAQQAAEQALRSILLGCEVGIVKTHDLDHIARTNSNSLASVWAELEPLLADWRWLWDWRNVAFYGHVDTAIVQEPVITEDDLDRAEAIMNGLVLLAVRIVGGWRSPGWEQHADVGG